MDNKGNEIIKKLQTDLKNQKQKLKLKNVVTLQQEKLLDERQVTIQGLNKQISTLQEQAAKKASESESHINTIQELKDKVEQGKAIIQDNNNGIMFDK